MEVHCFLRQLRERFHSSSSKWSQMHYGMERANLALNMRLLLGWEMKTNLTCYLHQWDGHRSKEKRVRKELPVPFPTT